MTAPRLPGFPEPAPVDATEPEPTWYTPAEAAKVLGVTGPQFDKLAATEPMLQPMTWQGGPERCFDRVAVDHVAASRS